MRIFYTTLVLAIFFALAGPLTADELTTKRAAKLNTLRSRVLTAPDYIIKMDSRDYRNYIEQGPRHYDVVILFSSDNCKLCYEVEKEFAITADHYKDKQSHYSSIEGGKKKRPVFFAIIKHTGDTNEIFRKHDLRSLPNLLVSTPLELTFADPVEKKMHQRQYLWEIQPTDGVMTASKLVPWVNSKVDRNIPYQESIWLFLQVFLTSVALLAIGVSLYSKFTSFFLNRYFWTFGVYAILYVGMCGAVYCVLNGSQWSGKNDKGQEIFIAQGSRTQYVSEGLIIAFGRNSIRLALVLVQSLIWIAFTLLHKVPYFGGFIKKGLYVVLLWTIFTVMKSLEQSFGSKNAYHPNFRPPAHYKRGTLAMDQGKAL